MFTPKKDSFYANSRAKSNFHLVGVLPASLDRFGPAHHPHRQGVRGYCPHSDHFQRHRPGELPYVIVHVNAGWLTESGDYINGILNTAADSGFGVVSIGDDAGARTCPSESP